jgi:cell division protease FtsH
VPPENKNHLPRWVPLIAIVAGFGLFYELSDIKDARYSNEATIPYSDFLQSLKDGKIAEVTVGPDTIEGQLKQPTGKPAKYFITNRITDTALAQQLSASGVKFSGNHEKNGLSTTFFSWILTFGFFFLIWSFILRRMGGATRGGGILSMGKSRAKVYVETALKTRFEDVAGVDEAKEELQEIVQFLKEPQRFSSLGGRMPKGVLLIGPPGTGKTLLARAVAGEAGVPFFSINGSEFVEMFVGLGAARVRDLFEQARAQAPCIIFIDELDALGKARGMSAVNGGANDEKEQTLNQLLAEMDGFDASRGLVMIAATNRPEILDPALLRAGRFDKSILVDKPDRLGRAQILLVHSRSVKLGKEVDLSVLAGITAGFSGADLANLVNEAALVATRRKADTVQLHDFTIAIERIVAGSERKNRLLNSKEKRRVAYHEMGHAIVALALGQGEVIHKVSIIPRGLSALGYTLSRPIEDRYLMERGELEAKMAIALGGRASEVKFFDDISTGAGDDLDKATDIARAMITRYGMSKTLGFAVYEKGSAPMLGGQAPIRSFDFSEKTAQLIDEEVNTLLDHAFRMADAVLEHYKELVEEAALLLIERETIDEAGLRDLWNKYHLEVEGPQVEGPLTKIA